MRSQRKLAAAALLLAALISFCSCAPAGSSHADGSSSAPEGKIRAVFVILGNTAGDTGWVDPGTALSPAEAPDRIEDPANKYVFLGWDADGDGAAESFPYTLEKDTTFSALLKAEPKVFRYDIYVKGELVRSAEALYGDIIEYPETGTVAEDGIIQIFMGWKYDGVFDGAFRPTVTGNTVIEACFADSQVLKLYYGGSVYARRVPAGDPLPSLAEWDVYPEDGYDVVWYSDSSYKRRAELRTMPEGSISLYGRREKQNGGVICVYSDEQLLDEFTSMVLKRAEKAELFLEYDHMPLKEIPGFLSENADTVFGYSLTASSKDGSNVTLEIEYPPFAQYTSDKTVYTQLPSANAALKRSDRGENYNAFAFEMLETALPVNNSEALYYALEHGMRPVAEDPAGETAKICAAMRDVLRTYVSDSMTDIEKAAAIYEYLVMNTVYDGELFDKVMKGESVLGCRSFCLEGVFMDHLAVCDGLSKAFSCLCRMEGIECVRVTGRKCASGAAHAWNKIRLGGKWYVVDVTSGGTVTGGEEVLSYAYFMLSDEQYSYVATPDKGYGTDIKCTDEYDFYSRMGVRASTPEQAAALLKAYIRSAPQGRSSYEIALGYKTRSDQAAVQEIMKRLNMSVNVSYLGGGGVFCFIYEN